MREDDRQLIVVPRAEVHHAHEDVDVAVGEDLGVDESLVNHGDAPGLGRDVGQALVGGEEGVADVAGTLGRRMVSKYT